MEYFLTTATGMPEEYVAPMREMPMWPAMEAGAHTLAYDGAVVGDSMAGRSPAAQAWAAVTAERSCSTAGRRRGSARSTGDRRGAAGRRAERSPARRTSRSRRARARLVEFFTNG